MLTWPKQPRHIATVEQDPDLLADFVEERLQVETIAPLGECR